jgi:chromosome segregation ATPase
LTENDAFEQVVGERSGCVKGMGFGPLPPKTKKRLCEELQKEMDHIRRERNKARIEREEARKERDTLTRKMARVEDQQQEMREQLNMIMQTFQMGTTMKSMESTSTTTRSMKFTNFFSRHSCN